jgi:hypothetical protein
MRTFLLAALACIAACSAAALPAATLTCQSCTHSVAELLKQVPILTRTKGVREGDKELALGDALPSMCAGNVFSGLASASELAGACKAFAVPGGAIEAALLAGKPAAEACAAMCEGVAEGERKPAAKAAPKAAKGAAAAGGGGGAKGAKATPKFREGSVDDPRVKAALKAKAARDARKGKGKKPAAQEEEVEEGAGDL